MNKLCRKEIENYTQMPKIKYLLKYFSPDHSLVESHLTYGIAVQGGTYNCQIANLEKLQRYILKIIDKYLKFNFTNQIFDHYNTRYKKIIKIYNRLTTLEIQDINLI